MRPLCFLFAFSVGLAIPVEAARFAALHSSFDAGGGYSTSSKFSFQSSLVVLSAKSSSPKFQNAQGHSNLLNEPPTTEKDFLQLPASGPLQISASTLTSNDRDLEQNSFTFSLIGAATARGGQVALANGTVTYTPPSIQGLTADSFTYAVTDSFGNQSIGAVNLFALSATPQFLSIQKNSTAFIARFKGSPNSSYLLQARPSFASTATWRDYPDILAPTNQSADAAGNCEFTIPISAGLQFFRVADISSLKTFLTSRVLSSRVTITLRGSPGLTYKLQFRPTLNSVETWSDYPNSTQPLRLNPATDGFYTFSAPLTGQLGFYRTVSN